MDSLKPSSKTDAFLQHFFNTSQCSAIVLMDVEGYISSINKVFTKFFGYTCSDLEGKHIRTFFTEEDRKKNLPERELWNVKVSGQASDNNYVVHKRGFKLWVAGESILFKSSQHQFIVKILQNIDEQKRIEGFLHETNEFIENIFHNIEDFIAVVDQQMRILKINASFLSYLKTQKAEGENLIKLMDSPQNQMLQDIVAEISNGIPLSSFELELYHKDKEKRYYSASATLIAKYKAEKRILLTFHDVTSEKMMEDQREDLVGFVSHELKNPITSISLYTELLKTENDTKKTKKTIRYLEKISDNIGYVQTMIDDLYEVTKAGSGHLAIHIEKFFFEEVIEEAVHSFEICYPEKKIIKKGNAGEMISGDRLRLLQVVMNLLHNAAKYAGNDTGVVLDIIHKTDKIIIGIIDSGMGIPKHKIPFIFNKYYRAQSGNGEGTGLGLYIAKQIIHAHHGEIWVESEEGKGSAFYFSIPI